MTANKHQRKMEVDSSLPTRTRNILILIFWILVLGSMFVYDPHLTYSCRTAKRIFQLPFVSLFLSIVMWVKAGEARLKFPRDALSVSAIIFAAGSFLAFIVSPLKMNAVWNLFTIMVYLGFFFSLRPFIMSFTSRLSLLFPIILSTGLVCIYAIFQYFGVDPIFQPINEYYAASKRWMVVGFAGQQTLFAGIIGPILPVSLGLIVVANRRVDKIAALIISMLILTTVILTHTRAVLLGYVIAFIAAVVMLTFKASRRTIYTLMILGLILSLVVLAAYFTVETFQKRIDEAATLSGASVKSRLRFWDTSFELFKEKPLTGHGLYSFRKEYTRKQIEMRLTKYGGEKWSSEFVIHPHNEILYVLVEGGIIWFLGVCLLTFMIIYRAFRNFLNASENRLGYLYLSLISALIILITDALFSFPFHVGTSALYTLIIAALAVFKGSEISQNVR